MALYKIPPRHPDGGGTRYLSGNTTLHHEDFLDVAVMACSAALTLTLPTGNAELCHYPIIISNASSGNVTLSGDMLGGGASATIPTHVAVEVMCCQTARGTFKWHVIGVPETGIYTIPTKTTGSAINTGTNDTDFATPKAIADSNVAFVADIPVKASGAEINTATDDAKFVTAKALADSNVAMISDIDTPSPAGIGSTIVTCSAKATPIDADLFLVSDSADSTVGKKSTLAQVKAVVTGATPLGAAVVALSAKSPPVGADLLAIADTEAANVGKKITLTQVGTLTAETTTTIGTLINGATAKATPVDADLVGFADTEAANVLKKATWTNIKAFLKTYFDGVYSAVAHDSATTGVHGVGAGTVAKTADIPTKAAGSDVNTGTNDTLFLTSKAVADSNLGALAGASSAVSTFTPTLTWTGGAPTVTAEVYRRQVVNKLCHWKIRVKGTNGDNATTLVVDFPAALIPTDLDMQMPCICQVSQNGGAYVEKVATLDCEAAAGADRQLTISPGTLTILQAFDIVVSGWHEIA